MYTLDIMKKYQHLLGVVFSLTQQSKNEKRKYACRQGKTNVESALNSEIPGFLFVFFFFWDEMGGGCLLARSPLWSSHSKLLSLGCLNASSAQYKRSTGRNLGDTVMVRRSSTTSRGTTYWFLYFVVLCHYGGVT